MIFYPSEVSFKVQGQKIFGGSIFPKRTTLDHRLSLISSMVRSGFCFCTALMNAFSSFANNSTSSVENILSMEGRLGPLTTMINSYSVFGSIFTLTLLTKSLLEGFSMNQHLNSFSELLIIHPCSVLVIDRPFSSSSPASV